MNKKFENFAFCTNLYKVADAPVYKSEAAIQCQILSRCNWGRKKSIQRLTLLLPTKELPSLPIWQLRIGCTRVKLNRSFLKIKL